MSEERERHVAPGSRAEGVNVQVTGAGEKIVMKNKDAIKPNTGSVVRQFTVSEPFEVKLQDKRFLDRKDCCKNFFSGKARKYRNRIGCYVFSLRTARGSLPFYVGKTWKSFESEVFTTHKTSDHYQKIVMNNKGTPTLTFVSLETCQGPTPQTVITELERHLIKMAYMRNERLSNIQGRPKTRWSIKGVVAAGPGAPTTNERLFKELMGY